MAKFTQLINREADLRAILDGYEQIIQRDDWLAEAIQKDGIQNSWGARLSKKGQDWSCKLLFREGKPGFPNTVIIEDSGTTGLTGSIPRNKDEEAEILLSQDPNQRLGRFLSSNWSVKTEHSLGSRGRGKMVFVGASNNSMMYFDSIRSDDNIYVFGSTFLDDNKEMQVEIYSEKEAHNERIARLGDDFPVLASSGTRIIIPSPKKEVTDCFTSNSIRENIKDTWWEILQKYDATILSGDYSKPQSVSVSGWLPVTNSGISETKQYRDVDIGNGLKIKKIDLVYLNNKSVPETYQGITIQRGGMKIQTRKIGDYTPELPNNAIYGSVEFDNKLDDEMLNLEGPEHYNFFWNKGVAGRVHRAIKLKVLDFAREYKIIDDGKPSSKKMRDAEVAVLKELNDIARALGLTGLGYTRGRKRKPPKPPKPSDPIRLTMPDFVTPSETGRVNFTEEVGGTYAIAMSDYDEPLKVLVETWLYKQSGGGFATRSQSKQLNIGSNIPAEKIGWDKVSIDDHFSKGCYHLKSRMTALEDKEFGSQIVKKADILGEASRSFWVNEDPPARGFWKDIKRVDKDEKNRLVWWDDEGDGYVLKWNGKHSVLKEAAAGGNEEFVHDVLRKEGAFCFWAIILSTALEDPEGASAKVKKLTVGLDDSSTQAQIDWLLQRRSETLWRR